MDLSDIHVDVSLIKWFKYHKQFKSVHVKFVPSSWKTISLTSLHNHLTSRHNICKSTSYSTRLTYQKIMLAWRNIILTIYICLTSGWRYMAPIFLIWLIWRYRDIQVFIIGFISAIFTFILRMVLKIKMVRIKLWSLCNVFIIGFLLSQSHSLYLENESIVPDLVSLEFFRIMRLQLVQNKSLLKKKKYSKRKDLFNQKLIDRRFVRWHMLSIRYKGY